MTTNKKPLPRKWRNLTPRQRETALFIMRGRMNNHEIADKMAISVKTVDTHRATALAQLALENNVQLALFGIRNGIIR